MFKRVGSRTGIGFEDNNGSRQQLSKIAIPGVTVGESLIATATAVRDLGAVFDMHMTVVKKEIRAKVSSRQLVFAETKLHTGST